MSHWFRIKREQRYGPELFAPSCEVNGPQGMNFKRRSLAGVLLLAAMMIAQSSVAQDKAQASPAATTIELALSSFLAAFNNLDWQAFRVCFSDNATVFHPAAPNVKRIDSPDQFEKAWLGVFERIRKTSGRSAPPYMNLQPQGLLTARLSEDVALVTFHLVDGATVSRRTLVFKKYPDGWKIVHLHASNITDVP